MENKFLSKLNNEKRIEILRKNWLSHDARWQMFVVQEFGWESGNKLNKLAAEDIGKVMMHRLMKAIGVTKIKKIDDFRELCYAAMDLYYPEPSMKIKFTSLSENKLGAVIDRCVIYDQVKKMEVDSFYECGCFSMRAGWYKALGFEAEEECLKCFKDGDNECIINVEIKKWGD